MSRSHSWCFTLNNYTPEEEEALKQYECSYLIFGYERGDNDTPHLQGYIEFANQKRFDTLKNFNQRIHWEIRKGTNKQASEYCKKGGNFFEKGQMKNPGHRSDLDAVRRMAAEDGMRNVTAFANYQGIRIAEKYLTYNEEPRDFKPIVEWYWGESGAGKSRTARETFRDKDYYTKSEGSKWWEGYDRHSHVIIDDFRDSWWPITEMLSLLDRYEKRVEFKGGSRQFLASHIIITSISSPETLYAHTGEAIKQLLRRIDVTRHIVPHVPEVAGVILDPAMQPDNIDNQPEDIEEVLKRI